MTRRGHARFAVLALATASLLVCVTPTSRARIAGLPNRLDDPTFWSLISEFSEANGFFRSDNLVSNETTFQQVIPALQADGVAASAYLGVGPDQNFTYIVALRPQIAFIVDIRRQNMLLHLMYKALIEMSQDRLEFLSRLFSRPKPAGLKPGSATADMLLAAFQLEEPDPGAFERNRSDIRGQLMRRHGFSLSLSDLAGIDYVYRAFYSAGPDIRYSFGRGSGWQPFPSYRDLMVETDADGTERSYLASEANYQTLRELERRNLIVPLVGDFAGPRALRSVGRYLDMHHATVSVFYTSNVEQYLFRGDAWQRFYDNVAALPIDSHSTFIRAFFNNTGPGFVFQAPLPLPDRRREPRPQGALHGPRSETLLNPISSLLAAYAEGHITSYYDVVELSR